MPRFVRELASYAAVALLSVVLTFYLMPAKLVVDTRTVAAAAAPEYAQAYMDAICRLDAEYLAEHTSPLFADADDVAHYVQAAMSAGWACGGVKYLGSYQTKDSQVFAVIVKPGTEDEHEVFYILTFEDGLVTEIE